MIPVGYVYWEVQGTPDTSGTYAPYSSANLSDIIILNVVYEAPYEASMFLIDLPPAGIPVGAFVLPRQKSLPVGLTNSEFVAQTAATASTTFPLMKNGFTIGSVCFGASATVGVPTFLSLQSFVAGDVLQLIGALPEDRTLANITVNLVFTDYIAQPAPTYTSISAATGWNIGGTSITITGSNFLSGAKVTIGGVDQGTTTLIDSNHISFTTAVGSVGLKDVVVTNPDTQFVDAGNVFTYVLPPPSFTSITPNSGTTAGGTSVTVNGTYFVSGATVYVDGLARTTTFVNPTTLTLTTPAHAAGSVAIEVINPDTQFVNTPNAYTFV